MKRTKAHIRRGTPVRRGTIFCSPACGRGCTHHEFKEAHRLADEAIRQLKTPGWKKQVWENLGWHFCLVNRLCGISLHADRYVVGELKWWTMFNIDGPLSSHGTPGLSPRSRYKDPNRAVSAQIRYVRAFIEKQEEALRGFHQFVKG